MQFLKYIAFFLFVSLMWVPPSFFGIPTNYEPWYHKIFDVLIFLPLIGAFLFGWFNGKAVYLKIGLCCLASYVLAMVLFAAYTAGLVGGAFGDILGYWEAYGSNKDFIKWAIICSAIPSFLAFFGGVIKEKREHLKG